MKDNYGKNYNQPKSFNVYLYDTIGIDDNSIPEILSIVKTQSDNKAMLERIWNLDRNRHLKNLEFKSEQSNYNLLNSFCKV